MSHSSQTVGKQGGGGSEKLRRVPFKVDIPSSKPQVEPTRGKKKIKPPKPSPSSEKVTPESLFKFLQGLDFSGRKEFTENMCEKMAELFTDRFGVNPTKESAARILMDEEKETARVMKQANQIMHDELVKNSTVPDKEVHLKKSKRAMAAVKQKLSTMFTSPGDVSAGQLVDMTPLLCELATNLFDAYGTTELIKKKVEAKPNSTVQDYVDNLIKRMPPVAEVIVDNDIDYLEELDLQMPVDVPNYLGRKETNPNVSPLIQTCENYFICKTFPLLLESQKAASKLFAMESRDIRDTVYVSAEEYDRRQILNRIRAKLRQVVSRTPKKTIGVRVQSTPAYGAFLTIRSSVASWSEEKRFQVFRSEASFANWLSAEGYDWVSQVAELRLDLMEAFPGLIGTSLPEKITAIPQTKSEDARGYLSMLMWDTYQSFAGFFTFSGKPKVAKAIRKGLQLPESEPLSVIGLVKIFASLMIAVILFTTIITFMLHPEVVPTQISNDVRLTQPLSHETAKLIFPHLAQMNSSFTWQQERALGEVSRIYKIKTETEITPDTAIRSVQQLSGTELKEFIENDIRTRIFYIVLNLDSPKMKDFASALVMLPESIDKSDSISRIYKDYSSLTAKNQPVSRESNMKIFEEVVEREIKLLSSVYSDIDALRMHVEKLSDEVTESRMLSSENFDQSLSVLSAYDDSVLESTEKAKSVLDNLIEIAVVEKYYSSTTVSDARLPNDLRNRLYTHYYLEALKRNPSGANITVDQMADLLFHINYKAIFDEITDWTDIPRFRASLKVYSTPPSPGEFTFESRQAKVLELADEIRNFEIYDPELARTMFVETFMLSIRGIARQFHFELTPKEAFDSIIRIMLLLNTGGWVFLRYMSYFGKNFGELSRYAYTAEKTWANLVIFTLGSMSMFYTGYYNGIGTILSALASPLPLYLSGGLIGLELFSYAKGSRAAALLFPLIGGFSPEYETTRNWLSWVGESWDALSLVVAPASGVIGALGATGLAFVKPVLGLLSATGVASIGLYSAWKNYDFKQNMLLVKMMQSVWKLSPIGYPAIWRIIDYLYYDDTTVRNIRGTPALDDATKNRIFKSVDSIHFYTSMALLIGMFTLSSDVMLMSQMKENYGLLRKFDKGPNYRMSFTEEYRAYIDRSSSWSTAQFQEAKSEAEQNFTSISQFIADAEEARVQVLRISEDLKKAKQRYPGTYENLKTLRQAPLPTRVALVREPLTLTNLKIESKGWVYAQYTNQQYYIQGEAVPPETISQYGETYKFYPETEYVQLGIPEKIEEEGESLICVRPNSDSWIWAPSYYFTSPMVTPPRLEKNFYTVTVTKPAVLEGRYFKPGEVFIAQKIQDGKSIELRSMVIGGGLGPKIPVNSVKAVELDSFEGPYFNRKCLVGSDDFTYIVGRTYNFSESQLVEVTYQRLNRVLLIKEEDLVYIPEPPFRIRLTEPYFENVEEPGSDSLLKIFGPSKYAAGQVMEVLELTGNGFKVKLEDSVPSLVYLRKSQFEFLTPPAVVNLTAPVETQRKPKLGRTQRK